MTADVAGRHLAEVALTHDFTFFETFLTDLVGHGRLDIDAPEVMLRIDELLRGVSRGLRDEEKNTTVVISSDHGNFEALDSYASHQEPCTAGRYGRQSPVFQGGIVDSRVVGSDRESCYRRPLTLRSNRAASVTTQRGMNKEMDAHAFKCDVVLSRSNNKLWWW